MNYAIGQKLTVFSVGGLCYGFIEILNRGFTHISMGLLGGIAFLIIHILNGERIKGNIGIIPIMLIGGFFITSIEFITGEYLNGIKHMNIWSYEEVPLNIDGQICLPFTAIWALLTLFGVFCDNFLRTKIFGEDIQAVEEYTQIDPL